MKSLKPTAAGTTPPGTSNEAQASRWVERMFAQIAVRYDLLNHLLSFNIDRSWRRVLLQKLEAPLRDPKAVVLDLCCGTGDVMLDCYRAGPAQIVGADFCHPMLTTAARKVRRQGRHPLLLEADALQLPVADASFDAIAIAFGFRNLANYGSGLREFHRILKPGGTLAILEFSHPRNIFVRLAYKLYSAVFLPLIGALISGSREAYAYLPDSIRRFPRAEQLRVIIEDHGFSQTSVTSLSGGIAALHLGTK